MSTLTRVSFGGQIRLALDDVQARGVICWWKIDAGSGALRYVLKDDHDRTFTLAPGAVAEWLNGLPFGYKIKVGS